MFSIFEYFNKSILYLREWYLAFIDYKWNKTITKDGKQYIKDEGEGKLDLQQYFGQGVWFNGVDQSISIGSVPVSGNMTIAYSFVPSTSSRILGRGSDWNAFVGFSTVSGTEGVVRCRFTGIDMVFTYRLTLGVPYNIILVLKPDVVDLWVNGILRESIEHTYTFAHSLEFIGRNSTSFANGVIKDIYVYNKHLTQTEIEKYNNQPNQFFMDALEDNACILAMPMCEKDGYTRNYVSYKKADFLILKKDITSTSTINDTRIGQENIGLLVEAGKKYEITYDFIPNVNFVDFKLYIPPTNNNGVGFSITVPISQFNGKCVFTVPSTYIQANGSTSCYIWIGVNGTLTTHTFKEISIKEIAGVYPITNYLATCRTNAQRLPYGLQTSGFKRDSNGLILGKSNFLEADGVGYVNTGWLPSPLPDEEGIEIIFKLSTQVGFRKLFSVDISNAFMVQNLSGTHTHRCYYRGAIGSTTQPENSIVYVVMTCNATTSFIYINGVLVTRAPKVSISTNMALLFINTRLSDNSNSLIRLFKVYTKALTQKEITDNFNKYDKLGLLSESGLPPEPIVPNNALVDENGNYILDENNNFIIVE